MHLKERGFLFLTQHEIKWSSARSPLRHVQENADIVVLVVIHTNCLHDSIACVDMHVSLRHSRMHVYKRACHDGRMRSRQLSFSFGTPLRKHVRPVVLPLTDSSHRARSLTFQVRLFRGARFMAGLCNGLHVGTKQTQTKGQPLNTREKHENNQENRHGWSVCTRHYLTKLNVTKTPCDINKGRRSYRHVCPDPSVVPLGSSVVSGSSTWITQAAHCVQSQCRTYFLFKKPHQTTETIFSLRVYLHPIKHFKQMPKEQKTRTNERTVTGGVCQCMSLHREQHQKYTLFHSHQTVCGCWLHFPVTPQAVLRLKILAAMQATR